MTFCAISLPLAIGHPSDGISGDGAALIMADLDKGTAEFIVIAHYARKIVSDLFSGGPSPSLAEFRPEYRHSVLLYWRGDRRHGTSQAMPYVSSILQLFFLSIFSQLIKMQSMNLLRKLSAYSNESRKMHTTPRQVKERDGDQKQQTKPIDQSDQPEKGQRETNDQSDQPQKKQTDTDDQMTEGTPIAVQIFVEIIPHCEKSEGKIQEERSNGGEEEEEEEEPIAEESARRRRRQIIPNEVVADVCDFMSFAEGNRLYTSNALFVALLEPKRKLCLAMFLKRVEETRQKLDKTIEEVNERRRHVVQLTENIGTINARLAEMGEHLANLDTQIVANHWKLDELQRRIEAMKEPIGKMRSEPENGERK